MLQVPDVLEMLCFLRSLRDVCSLGGLRAVGQVDLLYGLTLDRGGRARRP